MSDHFECSSCGKYSGPYTVELHESCLCKPSSDRQANRDAGAGEGISRNADCQRSPEAPRPATGEQSCKATVNEPCEYGGLWKQCDRHRRYQQESMVDTRDHEFCPRVQCQGSAKRLRAERDELRAMIDEAVQFVERVRIDYDDLAAASLLRRMEANDG